MAAGRKPGTIGMHPICLDSGTLTRTNSPSPKTVGIRAQNVAAQIRLIDAEYRRIFEAANSIIQNKLLNKSEQEQGLNALLHAAKYQITEGQKCFDPKAYLHAAYSIDALSKLLVRQGFNPYEFKNYYEAADAPNVPKTSLHPSCVPSAIKILADGTREPLEKRTLSLCEACFSNQRTL